MLLAKLVLSLFVAASTLSPVQRAHTSTKHITQRTVIKGAQCSATAIGPHALLTATHCEEPTDDLMIQGVDTDVTITKRIRDGQDHTIYLVSGVTFDNFVSVDTQHELQMGESVYIFGNPGEISDSYRHGYFSTLSVNTDPFSSEPDTLLFDMSVWYGDSGAGIFDSNGDLIGIVTGTLTQGDGKHLFQFTFAYALKFQQSDLNKARLY